MPSNETGHEKNIANFKALITYLESIGDKYQPSKASLKLPALITQYNEILQASTVLSKAKSPYSALVDVQEIAFEPLDKLLTRVIKNLRASVDDPAEAETAESLRNKIAGNTNSNRKKKSADDTSVDPPVADTTHSTSQRSYDYRTQNLNDLILTLRSIPAYQPAEDEIAIDTLEALAIELKKKVQDVDTVDVAVQNARIARNSLLYVTKTGVLDTVDNVKEYIGSLFGATSPQVRFINRLTFKKLPA